MMLQWERHAGGDDGTLVLLHSLGLDGSIWKSLLACLPRGFEAITLDLPNHGGSPGDTEASIESMADAVAELIRAEVDGPVIVIGMSLGGCVAQAVASRHPEVVRGLALLDTTAWYGESAAEHWEWRAQKAATEGLASLSEFQLTRWFTEDFVDRCPDIGQDLLARLRSNITEYYVATCRAMGAMDLRDQLGCITAPTTVIVGAEDRATPPSDAEDLRRRIPHAALHVIPDCRHLSAIERPETVARLLELDLLGAELHRPVG